MEMTQVSSSSLRVLTSAVELLMRLHDETVKKNAPYVRGFVHATIGRGMDENSDAYLDGYAAGGVVAEARKIGKTVLEIQHESARAPSHNGNGGTVARLHGYTGNLCQYCGSSRMVWRGTCECCEACGETNGCS